MEIEIGRLRKALEAKDIELHETKVHAESYASQALQDSRSKAEQALAFQKGTFDQAHAEYSLVARDICNSEVAQSTANLEALANSVIGEQQQELQTVSIIVANLQQHLSHAQQVAAQESQDKMLIESKAKATVEAQKATSAQQISSLRLSLESAARASHSEIVNAREKHIKTEAEELHSASMKQEQQSIDVLQTQLQTAMLDIKKLRSDLDTNISNYSDSEVHLAHAKAELRQTQESLDTSNGLLSQCKQSKELLEKENVVLRSNVSSLQSGPKGLAVHDSLKQAADSKIKELTEQLRAQADLNKAADIQAKADLDSLRLAYETSSAERLSSQAARLQSEHKEALDDLNFKFDNAQAAIATQEEEIQELNNTIQAHIN